MMAAERTLLAWLRTGIALMGFGFVVAKFALFLREFRLSQSPPAPGAGGISVLFGTLLILLGVCVHVAAGFHYLRVVRGLKQGGAGLDRPSRLGMGLALALALAGLAVAAWLLKGSA